MHTGNHTEHCKHLCQTVLISQDSLQFRSRCNRPVALHLPQAVRVDGVSAGQHCRRPHAVKQVLKAHRAVLTHAVLNTDVVVLHPITAP